MIRVCGEMDFETIFDIINEAAEAYRGIIPSDCWREPYMSKAELRHEIEAGIEFWGFEGQGILVGVMGIQEVKDVSLIRHAYVRAAEQGHGVGKALLVFLCGRTKRPVLVGTWEGAVGAIKFYERQGFQMVSPDEKDMLLRRYWSISNRQIAASVVLADQKWRTLNLRV